MLTQTSELAIRSLIFIALADDGRPISPNLIAGPLGCSPSYLAKTLTQLVRAGILQSIRGAAGGVLLARDASTITLLEIFEACQGILIGNYCTGISTGHEAPTCSYHQAMLELHELTLKTLAKWTLSDLLKTPSCEAGDKKAPCRMYFEGAPGKPGV